MYYVYVLYNLDDESAKKIYIGVTDDLIRRVREHNSGQSKWTSGFGPWKPVYYEAYLSAKDAINRERKLKHHGKGVSELKKRIEDSVYKAKKVRD
ncbi:hypothetical protein A3B18_04115 [Candidatus Giovannonibacteria bacterium RIFCSPLOWO2_01_FULL_46_13]|uniref:GIY-YIG domain-containing protein n=1 Tax=Candidatus Giovannonibacteria bacterium RIFCSPLOWO2_01_FULL_46_13 TaxID=1798352 RepID=A0A1F5X2U8_9BACT|nr:MAG: hypothetical protein A3B18_04115 [Candidatus Giovannonibacteria bacterium RIFCSPLOWO2_01_FULL_46_13]